MITNSINLSSQISKACRKTIFCLVKQYNYLGISLDQEMDLTPLVCKKKKKRVCHRIFQLRKVRKYMNERAAILVYKQTIMPIFDYAVFFLLISTRDGVKNDLQVMQNDAIRFCKNIRLMDRISLSFLHNSITPLSLEHRRQIQVLKLMYIDSQKGKSQAITNVNTKSQTKMFLKLKLK